jgi:Protein of unknown function, DUF261
MTYQDNPGLNINVVKWGCALLSALHLQEEQIKREYIPFEINAVYNDLVAKSIIRWDCYINDWTNLFEGISSNLRNKGKPIDPNYICKPNEREILCYSRKSTGGTHFVIGDGTGKLRIDTFSPSIIKPEDTVLTRHIIEIV